MQGRGSVHSFPQSRTRVQSPRRRSPSRKHARRRGREFRSRRKQRPPAQPNPKACPQSRLGVHLAPQSNGRAARPAQENKERGRAPQSQHRGHHLWETHQSEGSSTWSFSRGWNAKAPGSSTTQPSSITRRSASTQPSRLYSSILNVWPQSRPSSIRLEKPLGSFTTIRGFGKGG